MKIFDIIYNVVEMEMKNLLILLYSIIIFQSCSNNESASPNIVKLDSLAGTEWLFDSYVDKVGTKHFLSNYTNSLFSLSFFSESSSGISGCNKYGFNYKTIEDSIFIKSFLTTFVYCKLTAEYSKALAMSKKYFATKENLTLYTLDTMMVKMYYVKK
jgi:heat shock protein HslJ